MDRYCIVDSITDTVFNVIVWDGITEYAPPEGTYLAPANDQVEIGWIYDKEANDYFSFT